MKKFTLFMKEKEKENDKEKKFILVRHLQSPNSIPSSFLRNVCYCHLCDKNTPRTDIPNNYFNNF